MFVLEIISIVI